MPYNLDIPGWMTERSLKIIERWAEEIPPDGIMVEVGSFVGRSAWCWAKSVHPTVTVICIDRWEPVFYNPPPARRQDMLGKGRDTVECTLSAFRTQMSGCQNIRAIRARSPCFDATVDLPEQVDGVFLDERHKNPDFRDNVKFWWNRLKPGGLFAGDDFHGNSNDVINEVLTLANESRMRVWTYSYLWRFIGCG